jgi:hypothetical protein
MSIQNIQLPDPPKVFKAIKTGYDAITNHIVLVLFPVVLDALLWFGPHLRVKSQIDRLIMEMNSVSNLLSSDFQEMLQTSQDVWITVGDRINLFAALRSFPVGIFSLLSSTLPIQNPVGKPINIEVEQLQLTVLISLGLFIVGILVGGLYFSAVQQAAVYDEINWKSVFRQWPWFAGQSLLLSALFVVLFLTVFILGSCLATGFAFFSVALGQAVILLIGVLTFWVLYPLFFSFHGIYIKRLKAGKSMIESVKLTNLTFFKTGMFILAALLVTQGLDILWQVPPENSWLMVISILGHSFVTTGMLAASFVYYKDMDRWVTELSELRKQNDLFGKKVSIGE